MLGRKTRLCRVRAWHSEGAGRRPWAGSQGEGMKMRWAGEVGKGQGRGPPRQHVLSAYPKSKVFKQKRDMIKLCFKR